MASSFSIATAQNINISTIYAMQTELNESILVFLFLIDFDTSDKNAPKISPVKTLKRKERKNQIKK